MRIIAGKYRGTLLAGIGAGDPAAHLRPTSDRVRESLFNLLAHGAYTPLQNARVLDLFAGTGALGFEALSRGAAHVLFIDNGIKARGLIAQNTQTLRAADTTRYLRHDATRLGENTGAPFDLVFLDPPYALGLGEKALRGAQSGGWIAPGATIILEDAAAAPFTPIPGLALADTRRYGDTIIRILRAS